MGISSGIFTTPDSVVTMNSEKEPTLANWRMGCPFQVSRWVEARPRPGSLQRCGRPERQKRQRPQKGLKDRMTRSPGFT